MPKKNKFRFEREDAVMVDKLLEYFDGDIEMVSKATGWSEPLIEMFNRVGRDYDAYVEKRRSYYNNGDEESTTQETTETDETTQEEPATPHYFTDTEALEVLRSIDGKLETLNRRMGALVLSNKEERKKGIFS